jgi:hypothetical protein
MSNAITFIVGHHAEILSCIGGLVIAARVIVKLTPTPKDDSALNAVVNVLKHVGLHIAPDDK